MRNIDSIKKRYFKRFRNNLCEFRSLSERKNCEIRYTRKKTLEAYILQYIHD